MQIGYQGGFKMDDNNKEERILTKEERKKRSKERDKRASEETAFKPYKNFCGNNDYDKGDEERGWQIYA